MHYDFIAIPDADVPQAVDLTFQHVLQTYASEANKTVGVWRAVPDDLLDFKPQEKTNPIRTNLVHQLLFERRFFAQFVGTEEPSVEELLLAGDKPTVSAYLDKYIWLTRRRLGELPRDREIASSCQVGQRGYLTTRILRQAGFQAANVGGGYKTYQLLHPKPNGVH